MEKIKFFKLVSPYPEDETLGCNLKAVDFDDNFLAFKNSDISGATYDKENMVINIIRNDGEEINIDLSGIGDEINEKIEEAISGLTPGSGSTQFDINIDGELMDDGTLVLTWSDPNGEHTTEISGFLTEAQTEHDETIKGTGNEGNPLRLSDVEKTGKYKSVIGIVDELPTENLMVGDRYITKNVVSLFGRVYGKQGLEMVKDALSREESNWRVPSKSDWDKLLDYAEACDDGAHDGYDVGEYFGDIAGKVLKSVDYWDGNENLDTFGFSVFPAGYAKDSLMTGADYEARFWTDSKLVINTNKNFIKGFSYDHDNVLQAPSEDDEWYSIRLVRTIGKSYVGDTSNILGNTYNVINLPDIGQAWISQNLSYNPGDDYSEQYDYDHSEIKTEKYVLNHWNGKFWEKKELNPGDEINISESNKVTTYACVADEFGSQNLVKGSVYQVKNGLRRLVIDAGWY